MRFCENQAFNHNQGTAPRVASNSVAGRRFRKSRVVQKKSTIVLSRGKALLCGERNNASTSNVIYQISSPLFLLCMEKADYMLSRLCMFAWVLRGREPGRRPRSLHRCCRSAGTSAREWGLDLSATRICNLYLARPGLPPVNKV